MTNNKKTEYDKVMSFQFEDLPIRGRICQMSNSLNKIIFQHSYPDEISKVLGENKSSPSLPEDLTNLMRKAVRLGEHLKINKKDVHNTRALRLTEYKILRFVKYYRANNVLPDDWKYSLADAKLLVG